MKEMKERRKNMIRDGRKKLDHNGVLSKTIIEFCNYSFRNFCLFIRELVLSI